MTPKKTLNRFLFELMVKDSPNRKKIFASNIFNASPEEIESLIREIYPKCSDALDAFANHGQVIYRGESQDGDVLLLDYSKGTRRAQNTFDYYRILMDEYLKSKDFPLRGKSMICSGDQEYADSYGNTFAIFPFNGVKIADVGEVDIFDLTCEKMFELPEGDYKSSPNKISELIAAILRVKDKNSVPLNLTISKLAKQLDSAGPHQMLNVLNAREIITSIDSVEQMKEKFGIYNGKSFIDYLLNVVYPDLCKHFTLKPTSAFFKSNGSSKNEFWFSGPCFAFNTLTLDKWESHIRTVVEKIKKESTSRVSEAMIGDEELSVKEAAQIIKERGKEWEKFIGGFSNKNLNWLMYRGMDIRFAPDYSIQYPRTDRKPLSTKPRFHELADKYFKKNFDTKFRSESVFVVGTKSVAEYYGHPHVIFPLDRVSFAWSRKCADFTFEVDTKFGTNTNVSEDEFFNFMGSLEFHVNDDSLKTDYIPYRNVRKYEVMIKCDEYLAVRVEAIPELLDLLDYK